MQTIRYCKNCGEIIMKGDSYYYNNRYDFCCRDCYIDYHMDIIEKDMRSALNI